MTEHDDHEYAAIPPAGRLAAAVEILEWTVANLTRPIADDRGRDLVARAADLARDAVDRGAAIAPSDRTLIEEMLDHSDDAETGVRELLLGYYLCFDDLAPEIRPDRLDSIVDQCYQSMMIRDLKFDYDDHDDDDSPKRLAIGAYHDAVLKRHRG